MGWHTFKNQSRTLQLKKKKSTKNQIKLNLKNIQKKLINI